MDGLEILQLAALGLFAMWLYISVFPIIKKKEIGSAVESSGNRGRSILISEDLPNLFAEIFGVEDQGAGNFTLELNDGFRKFFRTYDEDQIVYLNLMQQLASDRAPVWITKRAKSTLVPSEINRIVNIDLSDLRQSALNKIEKGEQEKPKIIEIKEEEKKVEEVKVDNSEQEIKEVECPVCGRMFKNKKALSTHLKAADKRMKKALENDI